MTQGQRGIAHSEGLCIDGAHTTTRRLLEVRALLMLRDLVIGNIDFLGVLALTIVGLETLFLELETRDTPGFADLLDFSSLLRV